MLYSAMDQHIIYNSEHRVLICKKHKCGISPRRLELHLRTDHPELTLLIRREICDHATELDLVMPEQVTVFTEKTAPIPGLAILDGFCCGSEGCGLLAGTEGVMKKHVREHGRDKEGYGKVKVQSFFQGKYTRYMISLYGQLTRSYFEVHDPHSLQPQTFSEQLFLSYVDAAGQRDRQRQEEIDQVKDLASLVTKTPWLRYTKWEQTFIGCDMKALHTLTDLPRVEDVNGTLVAETVKELLEDCWGGYRDCVSRGWQLLPFWMASVSRDKESAQPFRLYIAPYTLDRYIGYWQSYIVFCMHMFQQPEEDRLVQFTPEQAWLMGNLIALLHTYDQDQEMELRSQLLNLSAELICHSDYSKQRSSLIVYTGIRGYNVEFNQWWQPQDYTTILAGLQFCIRMVILEWALPREERDEFSEESVMDPVTQFRVLRNKWLVDGESKHPICIVLIVGTPFGYIHRMLNYGIAASKNASTRSRIRWSADGKVLYFDGRALSLAHLKEFVHSMLNSAERMMSEELLFQKHGFIPEFDFDFVDNPSIHDSGYYFGLREQDAWRDARIRMIQRIRGIEGGLEMFERGGDSMEITNTARAKYNHCDEQFRELLAILIMFVCGISGRGTEMTSLRWMNTMDGDRSIYIEDGQVMVVTEYHKSMSLMDDQKVTRTHGSQLI